MSAEPPHPVEERVETERTAPAEAGASARARILGRIRSAVESRAAVEHPGRAPGAAGGTIAAVDLFATVLAQAGGEVVRLTDPDAAVAWVCEFATAFGGAAVSSRVPPALRPPLPDAEPVRAELGVSVAVAGGAATGTLILSSGEGRALQLLPPTHLVWIEERSIYVELEEALERARETELPAALALHSGPSKSADIGRIVVTGVHGPGRFVAAVVGFSLADVARG